MRKFLFTAVLVMASGATVRADVFPPTYFRCAADQLMGHPSEGDLAESRTGFGRTQWARTAYSYWANSQNQRSHANRFWQNTFNTDVEEALDFDTDLYPVYYNAVADALWVGPGPNNPSWFGTIRTQIAYTAYTGAKDLPAGVAIDALCEAGCYAPDQQLRFGDRSLAVASAQEAGVRTVTTLAPDTTIDAIQLMQNTVARYTADIAPAKQEIVTLHMKSGGELRVTTEHPLVTSDGQMRQAQALVVGDALVRDSGAADPVVSISRSTELTKVYNLRPTTTDLSSNILIAQGYLSGSARYQNEFVKYLNRAIFRHNIPASVIVRAPAKH